ncbi:hypothetical protein [Alkalicoccus chagannorensis]|uniref:hypothetical protein n=1 Tax=Alkalicoccus chagannorensis TaxID=427072 RepID=UPI0003FF6402|nr:hypothetical protein [Alkalicoccus chagannorensis]
MSAMVVIILIVFLVCFILQRMMMKKGMLMPKGEKDTYFHPTHRSVEVLLYVLTLVLLAVSSTFEVVRPWVFVSFAVVFLYQGTLQRMHEPGSKEPLFTFSVVGLLLLGGIVYRLFFYG